MLYSSTDQVNVLLPNKHQITATSDPTKTQVDVILSQLEAEANVALAAGGQTSPATDPQQVLALGLLVTNEAVRLITAMLEGIADDGKETAWDRALTLMRAGEWAAAASAASNPAAPSSQSDIDPWFTRDRAEY